MAAGLALVVFTLEGFVASVVAGGAAPVAAFFVARMSSAISQLFTFYLAGVDFGTLNLFGFSSAAARFVHHLMALRAGSSVTPLRAGVSAASQDLAAGVTASWGCFGAREIIV